MNQELLSALVAASVKLQESYAIARRHNREDICQRLREAQWKIAAAISDLVPDSAAEVPS